MNPPRPIGIALIPQTMRTRIKKITQAHPLHPCQWNWCVECQESMSCTFFSVVHSKFKFDRIHRYGVLPVRLAKMRWHYIFASFFVCICCNEFMRHIYRVTNWKASRPETNHNEVIDISVFCSFICFPIHSVHHLCISRSFFIRNLLSSTVCVYVAIFSFLHVLNFSLPLQIVPFKIIGFRNASICRKSTITPFKVVYVNFDTFFICVFLVVPVLRWWRQRSPEQPQRTNHCPYGFFFMI